MKGKGKKRPETKNAQHAPIEMREKTSTPWAVTDGARLCDANDSHRGLVYR